MILEPEKYNLFLNVHLKLLHFVSIEYEVFGKELLFKEFKNLDIQEKFECREYLIENLEILDYYIKLNFDKLTQQEINILEGFKRSITGDFVIFKILRKHAILIHTETNNVYGVLGLSDTFNEFFEYFPALAKLTILPFEDIIIYDGFLNSYNMSFGPGIRNDLNEIYRNAKIKHEIITRIK